MEVAEVVHIDDLAELSAAATSAAAGAGAQRR